MGSGSRYAYKVPVADINTFAKIDQLARASVGS
jgi:hypothetical protein